MEKVVGYMHELAKKQRAEYMRKWRAKPENKKKTRLYNSRYWHGKACIEVRNLENLEHELSLLKQRA